MRPLLVAGDPLSATTMALLPYQSPPLLPLDSTHRGSLVVIAGAIAGAVTLTGLLIRLYIHLAINPHYGRDDYFLLGSAVSIYSVTIVSTAILTYIWTSSLSLCVSLY